MIKKLEVKNFKSLKNLKLNCKRINLFIGKPNTGKSNILESLGVFSFPYGRLEGFVRFENMSNLFYDENLDKSIKIEADDRILEIKFEDLIFRGKCSEGKKKLFALEYDYNLKYDYNGWDSRSRLSPFKFYRFTPRAEDLAPFKFYRFTIMKNFLRKETDSLLPPFGENLLSVLMTHKELKTAVSEIFNSFGFDLILKPQENKIEVLKLNQNILISYPYSLVSDTLQRIVFYHTVIHSNKDSILAFEEPESHVFPYCTKCLAEKIALDENNNQYFISTHDPYFLLSVLEKSPKDEVRVFITYFEKYQTKVRPLIEKEIEETMEMGVDIFSNIERFLGDRK
jgi:hypothetical protein